MLYFLCRVCSRLCHLQPLASSASILLAGVGTHTLPLVRTWAPCQHGSHAYLCMAAMHNLAGSAARCTHCCYTAAQDNSLHLQRSGEQFAQRRRHVFRVQVVLEEHVQNRAQAVQSMPVTQGQHFSLRSAKAMMSADAVLMSASCR